MAHNNTSTFPHTAGLSEIDKQFRQWLQNLGIWPDQANRLFMILSQQPRPLRPISSQTKQMLPIVIRDARREVEIAVRYPAFFRDLLHDATLRREFMSIAVATKPVIERHGMDFENRYLDSVTL